MFATAVSERAAALFDRITALDGHLKAYVAIDRANVLREAARLDALQPRDRGPLHGVMLGVKDIIDVAGLPTRAGSSFFERLPTEDAPVVRRLREAGALVVGKTNTHEFAWGITTENPHFGRTTNPWDIARIVGGSSGGAGAVIAADLADLALGTDTLGSIRIPSALCGLTGLRPPTGVISMKGIVPLAPGMDTVGPIAHDVAMVSSAYQVLTGPLSTPLRLRVCRLRGAGWDAIEPCMRSALDAVAMIARSFPAPIEIADVPWWESDLVAATTTLQQAAVKAENFHAPLFALHRERYGDDVRERVASALDVDDITVAEARATIERARASWISALRGYDLAIAPIVYGEAPLAPAPASFRRETIPLAAPASAFGLPALALPIGTGPAGMPLGMQVITLAGDASIALAFGALFQQATNWHRQRPAIEEVFPS